MSVFLTDGQGITSTSANFLANLAKEQKAADLKLLSNLLLTNVSVELINGDKKPYKKGLTSLKFLRQKLLRIGELNAFCAWLREAIKEKEALLEHNNDLTFDEFCELQGIVIPKRPIRPGEVTAEDVMNTWSIKEKQNYLRLEALASTIGNAIHPQSSPNFASSRNSMYEELANPTTIRGEGRDLVIYTSTPSVDPDEVEEVFVDLQNLHREYEKQLNSIKYHLKEEVNKKNLQLQQDYEDARVKYSDEICAITSQLKVFKTKENQRISSLKIVIPEKFQSIYEELNSL